MVLKVKAAVALAKDNKLDEMYAAYGAIFGAPGFTQLRPEDQRQALKLMVHFKNAPKKPTDAMNKAHEVAIAPLTELVSVHGEPADFEMLGMCHLLMGREEAASNMFRAGLKIERERSPGSDLCGTLMRRVSEL